MKKLVVCAILLSLVIPSFSPSASDDGIKILFDERDLRYFPSYDAYENSIFSDHYSGFSQLLSLLSDEGYEVYYIDSGNVTSDLLSAYDIFIISNYHDYTAGEKSTIEAYYLSGGSLLVLYDMLTEYSFFGFSVLQEKKVCDYTRFYGDVVYPVTSNYTPHVICQGLGDIFFNWVPIFDEDAGTPIIWSESTSWLDYNSNKVKDQGEQVGPFPIVYVLESEGGGKAVMASDMGVFANWAVESEYANGDLFTNIISWLAPSSSIVITSSPSGGVVLIDGISIGTTPVHYSFAPGQHEVTISKSGYIDYHSWIIVEGGCTYTLDATLEENPHIRVSGTKDAVVSIDGTVVGVIPLDTVLDPGTHTIRASKAGYVPQSIIVSLAPGDDITIEMGLERELDQAREAMLDILRGVVKRLLRDLFYISS